MKLCLGTAQFGMNYGIQGAQKPTKADIYKILGHAVNNGIDTLDTASGYGDAESILGDFMNDTSHQFDIISKLSYDIFQNLPTSEYMKTASDSLETSLLRMHLPKLKGLLFHNPNYLYDVNAIGALQYLKHSGLTDHIGVSVYSPQDAEYALNIGMDMIQLPVNIFDRRFDLFLENAGKDIKIFARSIFLQGLLLMDISEVEKKLPLAVDYVKRFYELCSNYPYSRREIAFSYLKKKKGVHTIVFGVDNLDQLKENMEAFHQTVPTEIVDEIATQFENISETIVSPLNWRISK
jgi:aryl-alcohol dehydrogenase-like predicted oxidoreductase